MFDQEHYLLRRPGRIFSEGLLTKYHPGDRLHDLMVKQQLADPGLPYASTPTNLSGFSRKVLDLLSKEGFTKNAGIKALLRAQRGE
jgi:hypothetical protein